MRARERKYVAANVRVNATWKDPISSREIGPDSSIALPSYHGTDPQEKRPSLTEAGNERATANNGSHARTGRCLLTVDRKETRDTKRGNVSRKRVTVVCRAAEVTANWTSASTEDRRVDWRYLETL